MNDTAQIWSLDTGKLMASPFESIDLVGAIRFPGSPLRCVDVDVGELGSSDSNFM